jgi:hypothetical protein
LQQQTHKMKIKVLKIFPLSYIEYCQIWQKYSYAWLFITWEKYKKIWTKSLVWSQAIK